MQQDPSLHDEQLEDEIELVSELVLAASQTEGRLSEQAIDEVLGVDAPAAPVAPAVPEAPPGGDTTAETAGPTAVPGADEAVGPGARAPRARGDAAAG